MKKYGGMVLALLVCCVSIVGCEKGKQIVDTVVVPRQKQRT